MAPLIAVVDDDPSVREGIESLMRSVGLKVRVFASAEEFLEAARPGETDCLVLDVRLGGMSGVDLNRRLVAGDYRTPVVFITAHGSDDLARREAASDWTAAYLTKPFSEDELLDAVNAALKWEPRG